MNLQIKSKMYNINFHARPPHTSVSAFIDYLKSLIDKFKNSIIVGNINTNLLKSINQLPVIIAENSEL